MNKLEPYPKFDPAEGFIKPLLKYWMEWWCPKSDDNKCHYITEEQLGTQIGIELIEIEDEKEKENKYKKLFEERRHLLDQCIMCKNYDYGSGFRRKYDPKV